MGSPCASIPVEEAGYVREARVPAGEAAGDALVVQAQVVENRRVEVLAVHAAALESSDVDPGTCT